MIQLDTTSSELGGMWPWALNEIRDTRYEARQTLDTMIGHQNEKRTQYAPFHILCA